MAETKAARLRAAMLATLLACGIVAPSLQASPARASTTTRSRATDSQTLLIPGSFRLQASNGYSFFVLSAPPRAGRPGGVEIFVSGKRQGVRYSAPAAVTETSIQADLGELGEIAVTFHPSGQPTTIRPRCGDGRLLSFDSGYYEGRIVFHGEEGYTEVDATSAPGNVDFWRNLFCVSVGGGSGGGLSPPGAELHIRNPQLGPEFTAIKRRPNAPALLYVLVSEYRSGISIKRDVGLRMPSSAFRYDHRLRTATLTPPSPFSGTGLFDRSKKAGQRWSGDLSVDMPGRENVPLTGTALRATLVPAG